MLVQRCANTLRNPALNLPIHHHGIDNCPAVLNHDVAEELNLASIDVHLNRGTMGRIRAGCRRALVWRGRFEPWLLTGHLAIEDASRNLSDWHEHITVLLATHYRLG